MKVAFTPSFLRQVKRVDKGLQNEVAEKIELFKNPQNHKMLRVHKLKGPFSGCYSFSVNYKIRIVFEYITQGEVLFHAIGNHSIYN